MTFVFRAGAVADQPLPAFKSVLTGGRWEYVCGWCDDVFMDAKSLIAHVVRERARCEK